MDILERRYEQQRAQYDRELAELETAPNLRQKVERLRQLNRELTSTLDQLIQRVAQMRDRTGNINVYRDELITKLTKIQKQYDELSADRDAAETIRRIRAFEDTEWKRTSIIYMISFLILAIIVFLVLLFFQKKEKATIMPTTATTMTPLT